MGANGAGKSHVGEEFLTGAVRPNSGRTTCAAANGRSTHPLRRAGVALIPVYQEPALIPDLDIRSNLRLTDTPLEPYRHWMSELGLPRPEPRQRRPRQCRWHGCASSTSLAHWPPSQMC